MGWTGEAPARAHIPNDGGSNPPPATKINKMNLSELKNRVDFAWKFAESQNIDPRVVVPTSHQGGVGGINSVDVVSAENGFDWNRGLFIITLESKSEVKRIQK